MQLINLIEEAKTIINNPKNYDDKKKKQLVSLIRNAIEEKFSITANVSRMESGDVAKVKKYLDVAKKLEQTIEALKKKWSSDIQVVKSEIFDSPLSSKEHPSIQLIGFTCANHSLRLNGRLVRRLNGISFIFALDDEDERVAGLSPGSIVSTGHWDFSGKSKRQIASMKEIQRDLSIAMKKEICNLNLVNYQYAMFFTKDTYLEVDKIYFFKWCLGKSEGENCYATVEMSIEGIISEIHEIYYIPLYNIGRVNDGGKRYSR